MNLNNLLTNPPRLHQDRSGNLVSWKLGDQILSFIDRTVTEDSRTLETGAGISTVLFALKGTHHTCVVPNAELVERIKSYCDEEGISTDKIDFRIGRSEDVLPHLTVDFLDLILIDGRHAFPSPFIDWYYSSRKLADNGVVIVDDLLIWTGKVLKEFLNLEESWVLKEDFKDACVFMKVAGDPHQKTWPEQPYIVQQSRYHQKRWLYRINKGFQYLLQGDIAPLKQGLAQLLK